MKFKKLLLLLLVLILFILNYTEKYVESRSEYYRDQDTLKCEHNINTDIKVYRKTKKAVLFIDTTNSGFSKKTINYAIGSTINNLEIKAFKITPYSTFITEIYKKKLINTIKDITQAYKETEVLMTEELAKLGKKLNYDFFLIPIINEVETIKERKRITLAYGDDNEYFSWPDLKGWEQEMSGTAKVEFIIFDIKKAKVITEDSEAYSLSEGFDTSETFQAKQKAIVRENKRRKVENSRRERILRKKSKKKKSKGEKAFEILDMLTGEDYLLEILKEPNFKTIPFKSEKDFSLNLCTVALSNPIIRYFNKFDGETISGDTINGNGKFNFLDGDTYIGDWKNAKAHGKGIYNYKNGEVYEGNFVNGRAEGNGKFKDKKGNIFIGTWLNGKKDGKGTYTFRKTGNTVECIVKKGKYIRFIYPKPEIAKKLTKKEKKLIEKRNWKHRSKRYGRPKD